MKFLLYGIIGVILLIMAYLLGIKLKIELMHDYHTRKVKKQDVKAYCQTVGIGFLIIGLSWFGQGIYAKMMLSHDMTIICYGTFSGLITIIYAQYRYNGGIFK